MIYKITDLRKPVVPVNKSNSDKNYETNGAKVKCGVLGNSGDEENGVGENNGGEQENTISYFWFAFSAAFAIASIL